MSTSESHASPSAEATTSQDDAKWYQDRVLVGIMAVAALLGLIYNGVVLLGYGPDEPRHMNYVKLLLDERRLPYITASGAEYAGAHSLHPPLYYLLLTPFYALARGLPGDCEWHLLRAVSLVLCLATLPLVYQVAQRAGGGDKSLSRLVVAQVALLPIFGMTAGTINNDSAMLLAVVLFLWLLAVKYPHERTLKSAFILGICFGLGGLCKATVLICDGAALLLYLLAQDGRAALRSSSAWTRLAVVLLCIAVLSGPWYGRNLQMYGKLTPVEPGYSTPFLPSPANGVLVMMMHPNFPMLFAYANWSIFYTLWSQKDWIPESVRLAIYLALAAYCALAIVGASRWKWSQRSQQSSSPEAANDPLARRMAVWTSYGAFAANWLACLVVALFVHWGWAEGGRYLLPALVGLSTFLARGWRGLIGSQRLNALTAAWSAALLAVNTLAIYWLLTYLNPTFGSKG